MAQVKTQQKRVYAKERAKGASIRKAAAKAKISKNTGVALEQSAIVKSEMHAALDKIGCTAEKIAQTVHRNLDAQKCISANIVINQGKPGATAAEKDGMKPADAMTKDFVEVPDCMAQLKAAELAGKFRSDFVERVEHSGGIEFNYSDRLEAAKKRSVEALLARRGKA